MNRCIVRVYLKVEEIFIRKYITIDYGHVFVHKNLSLKVYLLYPTGEYEIPFIRTQWPLK